MMITVRVPATTANLGPGFDCLGLALALYNQVEFRSAEQWSMSIAGEGADQLKRSQDNLVWRAACRVWQEAGLIPPQGLALHLDNRIPLGRGLGSSAAAIVAGMIGANAYSGFPVSQQRVLELATEMEGHPDNVAPAILGGFVTSAMTNGGVVSVRLPINADVSFGVCIPDFILPTAIARQAIPQTVPHPDAVFNIGRATLMMAALMLDRPDLLPIACQDRLHQPYRMPLIPGFAEVKQAALQAGALGLMISGAGPTILSIVGRRCDHEAVGEAMRSAFAKASIQSHFVTLQPDLSGAQVEERSDP